MTIHPFLDKMYVVDKSCGINDACVIVHGSSDLELEAASAHEAGITILSAAVLKSVVFGSALEYDHGERTRDLWAHSTAHGTECATEEHATRSYLLQASLDRAHKWTFCVVAGCC